MYVTQACICPARRSFLLVAQFWHTWEKMHESSKIFVDHVQYVALVQLPTQAY